MFGFFGKIFGKRDERRERLLRSLRQRDPVLARRIEEAQNDPKKAEALKREMESRLRSMGELDRVRRYAGSGMDMFTTLLLYGLAMYGMWSLIDDLLHHHHYETTEDTYQPDFSEENETLLVNSEDTSAGFSHADFEDTYDDTDYFDYDSFDSFDGGIEV